MFLRDRVRSSVMRERLRVESLLLCLERSQLRWFGHLVRMPLRHLLIGRPRHIPLEGDLGADQDAD